MEDEIKHFGHRHPLRLRRDVYGRDRCAVCRRGSMPAEPTMYTCATENCGYKFTIHKSCAELPREMVHPFHPHHPLSLLPMPPYDSGYCGCDACGKPCRGFTFHCSQCRFDLHATCASLFPSTTTTTKSSSRDEETIQHHHHLGHPHPLILCENRNQTNVGFQCSGCRFPFKKGHLIYVCLECSCLLDESCTEWPSQIQHPFHPQHLLSLLPQPPNLDPRKMTTRSLCRACGKVPEGLAFFFHCSECEFSLDPSCTSLTPTARNSIDNHHQFSHPHPLTQCELKRVGFPLPCNACNGQFDDHSTIYICLDCRFLLHKSCAELPREVRHSFYHHEHALHLLDYWPLQAAQPSTTRRLLLVKSRLHEGRETHEFDGHFRCYACYRYTSGFAYACPECKVYFDIRCPLSKPRLIKSELHHQHPLVFFDVQSEEINCKACKQSCRSPFVRCVECNFNLHVKCVPRLPMTVESKHHRHPLTLTESPIKDRPDEDENAELYCDDCEKPRGLFERTYYCEECHYVAHVDCLLPQVLCILEEEWSLACKHEETVISTGDEITGRGDSSMVDSSLVELDEEIIVLRGEVESLAIELKAKERRLKELEERRAQHVASELPNCGQSENV